MSMRHIINHNPVAWADDYLALMRKFDAHASEIETAQPSDAISWHIVDQLKSMARAAFDVQACILRANDIPHIDPITDNKESSMDNIFNIHSTALAQAAAIISKQRSVLSDLLLDSPGNQGLSEAWGDLGEAIDKINSADMEWYEADEPVDMWDATAWRKAGEGDLIKLRDPDARNNGGPVYRIDGVPAWRADGTLSVHAVIHSYGGTDWSFPSGPSLMEFSESAWQVWHDFSDVPADGSWIDQLATDCEPS